MTSYTFKQNEIEQMASRVIKLATSKTVCFYGSMGVGKTTLIKALVKKLGADGDASSPTFGIVNEYQDLKDSTLAYHFDCYRLEEETEVLDLGFEDYLSKDVWIFIEWPEKIKSFLPENTFDIHIEIKDLETRKITF